MTKENGGTKAMSNELEIVPSEHTHQSLSVGVDPSHGMRVVIDKIGSALRSMAFFPSSRKQTNTSRRSGLIVANNATWHHQTGGRSHSLDARQ